jgi:hypothetical protein
MTIGVIHTVFLMHLEEAAKALKNSQFQIIGNRIVGLDNTDQVIQYTTLSSEYYNPIMQGVIISTRELSKFIKSILLESEFEIMPTDINGVWRLHSSTETLDIIYPMTPYIVDKIAYRLSISADDAIRRPIIEKRELINDNIADFFTLKKKDGIIKYIHNNKFLITIFQGLLTVSKSDKIYLTIHEYDNVSFVAHFEVVKKKFVVNVFTRFLYL